MAKFQRTSTGKLKSQPRHPVTGKRITITADTRADLESKLARFHSVRTDIRLGGTIAEAERQMTPVLGTRMQVRECYLERYVPGLDRSREKALTVWGSQLAATFGDKTLWELTADLMKIWEAEQRRAGYALSTVGLAYDLLAAAVNLQVPSVIPGLPWGKWRPKRETKDEKFVNKRPAVYDLQSLGALVAQAVADDRRALERGRYSVRGRLVTFVTFNMLRQSEAAGLAWDHVDIDTPLGPNGEVRNVLFVEFQAAEDWWKRHADRPRDMPKDGPRRLLMHWAIVELLREQRTELQRRGWYREDGPVWPARAGQWIRTGKVLEPAWLRRWATAAGLPRAESWCVHSLRHSGCMLELGASGGDLIGMMKRSGHADVRSARGYLHSMGGQLPQSAIGNARLLSSVTIDASGVLVEGSPESRQLPGSSPDDLRALLAHDVETRVEVGSIREQKQKDKHERSHDSLEDIYRRWVEAGKPGEYPSEVLKKARRHYVRGYNEAMREGIKAGKLPNKPEWAAAGKRAKGRFLGAWALAVKRLSKVTPGSEAAQ